MNTAPPETITMPHLNDGHASGIESCGGIPNQLRAELMFDCMVAVSQRDINKCNTRHN
jgi:hypothetical protein